MVYVKLTIKKVVDMWRKNRYHRNIVKRLQLKQLNKWIVTDSIRRDLN